MNMAPQGRRNVSYPQRPRIPSLIESQGPEGKIRGNPSQLVERYMALGRDALRDGDGVSAEGFFQHAEHYRRMVLFTARRAEASDAGSGERGGERSFSENMPDSIQKSSGENQPSSVEKQPSYPTKAPLEKPVPSGEKINKEKTGQYPIERTPESTAQVAPCAEKNVVCAMKPSLDHQGISPKRPRGRPPIKKTLSPTEPQS